MKYIGNTYEYGTIKTSIVSALVVAQCYCGTQSCESKGCALNWNMFL